MAELPSPAWTYGLKALGKAPIAVMYQTFFPIYLIGVKYAVVTTCLDCKGLSLYRAGSWRGENIARDKIITFHGCGVITTGAKGVDVFPGMFQDLRTLQMMKDACCPPQIMEDFIRQERFSAVGGDTAEEALLLHKRGYLGGAY